MFRVTLRGGLLAVALVTAVAVADEGMWDFKNLPTKQIEKSYGFVVTDTWADKVMKSSVKFPRGSGSFVSANGLVITNHHVASDTIKKLSKGEAEENYYKNGYFAKKMGDELKAPDLELTQLISIEDVTERVNKAVTSTKPEEAAAERKAEIARIEKESLEKYKLQSQVVPLYQGGAYHLYRYKKYTDVRLVFAPESAMAFFGGDPDNFEFPRFDLDVTFFRVYEEGKPAKIENYFKWSAAGTKDGDLTFVSGNPGSTSRLFTEAAIRSVRDLRLPFTLAVANWKEILLQTYSGRGEKQRLQAESDLFGIANSRKVYLGRIAGLQDPALIKAKQDYELDLKSFAQESDDEEVKKSVAAWSTIQDTLKEYKKHAKGEPSLLNRYSLLEQSWAFDSRLFEIARTLVRMAAEDGKANDKRMAEYRDSNRDSLKVQLYSTAPLFKEFEQFKLAKSLSLLVTRYGAQHALVRAVLQGRSPEERATELVDGTSMEKVGVRKGLGNDSVANRQAAIKASEDPMIRLAVLVDEEARKARADVETKITEPQLQAYAQISKVRFKKSGTSVYPDATFTLRLSYGKVKGFKDGKNRDVEPYTTLDGAFKHELAHLSKEPYALSKKWHDNKGKLKLDTPFNFVTTNDIIGGNSGSPVINQSAEFVGIIFDGNIYSLTSDYLYSDKQSRAVAVDSRGIVEALRNVYDAGTLADELTK